MRRFLAVLVFATFLASVTAAQPESPVEAPGAFAKDDPALVDLLKKASDEIKGRNVYDCIDKITTDPIGLYRVMGTPSQGEFIKKYGNVFSTVSPKLKSHVVHFTSGGPGIGSGALPTGGNNIIGVLPGKDLTKWVVFGGHYDTREATLGGAAIDNTSGICTVKEFARAFTALNIEPAATIVFAWWDGEEWGLYGSRAFVADHSATKTLLGLDKDAPVTILMGNSHDIVGINYPAYNTWVTWGAPTDLMEYAVLNLRTAPFSEENATLCPSYGCYRNLPQRDDWDDVKHRNLRYHWLVREVAYSLLKLPDTFVQARDDKYGRSDQVPFIAAGIPGMRVQGSHDNQWPHYHQPSDTLATASLMAGGMDKLLDGFTTEARVGGLTGLYVAMTADYGQYHPDAEKEAEAKRAASLKSRASAKDTSTGTPAPGVAFALIAVLVAVAIAPRLRR
ncbi:MAG: M28 family peptidase [Euryarchaeota archaeon]|nr:M28 family peptidase [Euryarchaeota archaeon]